MSQSVEARLDQDILDAQLFESVWDWSDAPAGRLLTVDQNETLVSVLVDDNGEHPPEPRDETAIWGASQTNSLVVVLKALFTWQLENNRDSQNES